jgi:hypothetical protein
MDMEFSFDFTLVFAEPAAEVAQLRGANVVGICRRSARGTRWIIGRLGGDTVTPPP